MHIFYYIFFFSGMGIWDIIIAEKTKIQPTVSQIVMVVLSIKALQSTANTDSKLMISDAAEGSRFFCAIICREYATPMDRKPTCARGAMHLTIPLQVGVSVKAMTMEESAAQTIA